MSEKPKLRWFAFRLRTLLVVVAVLSVPLAWVAYSLEWIRERKAIELQCGDAVAILRSDDSQTAPGGLWLLGEHGARQLWYHSGDPRVTKLQRLFPEADFREGERWFIH